MLLMRHAARCVAARFGDSQIPQPSGTALPMRLLSTAVASCMMCVLSTTSDPDLAALPRKLGGALCRQLERPCSCCLNFVEMPYSQKSGETHIL